MKEGGGGYLLPQPPLVLLQAMRMFPWAVESARLSLPGAVPP